jgi:hypothetical protein
MTSLEILIFMMKLMCSLINLCYYIFKSQTKKKQCDDSVKPQNPIVGMINLVEM